MNSSRVIYPIFLGIALVLGICIGVLLDFPTKPIALTQTEQREQKLRQIINYIDYEYVDNLNTDSLLDLTISNLLQKLDPHSTYIPLEQISATEENMRGSFEGIGIEFKIYRDTLTVLRTIEDGPSEKAGIRNGDRILTAGDVPLFGRELSTSDVINTLKGEAGTQVALGIYSPGTKDMETVKVTRDAVPLKSVVGSFMLDDKTGYLKVVRFSQTTAQDLRKQIRRLKGSGAKKVVLDLRDNPGGLLTAAREVADEFLEDDRMIVFTKDRQGNTSEMLATSSGSFEDGSVAILINENSASASEIVAGAIQDNDRGWIVGRKSFGKGLVQEEMTLNDGSKIRLTTSRYYTPSGRSIQKPFGEYDHQYLNSSGYEGGHDMAEESGEHEFYTRAGRKVYGGGGITPDAEVAMDTGRAAAILYHLSMLTNVDEKAFRYVDAHRNELSKWTEDSFVRNFEVDNELLRYFFGAYYNRLINKGEADLEPVKARIKSYLAYNLFGNEAFLRSYATYDPTIAKAMQLLNETRLLKK